MTTLDPIDDLHEIVQQWATALDVDLTDDEPEGDECPDCDGSGEVDLSLRAPRTVECERCDGEGVVDSEEETDDA